jgi:hypothetical protein
MFDVRFFYRCETGKNIDFYCCFAKSERTNKLTHPNSLKNLTYHEGRSPLPYTPVRLQVPLDPALVKKIEAYKEVEIKTKNGRNRAIAQLIELGLEKYAEDGA